MSRQWVATEEATLNERLLMCAVFVLFVCRGFGKQGYQCQGNQFKFDKNRFVALIVCLAQVGLIESIVASALNGFRLSAV